MDILVNNAGIWKVAALDGLARAELEDTFRSTSLNRARHAGGAAGDACSWRGSIINISSTAGLHGVNGLGAYCASKWAVRGLTKVAAMELGLHRIRVNSIHPGGVDTPMSNPTGVARSVLDGYMGHVPLQRIGGPEEISRASLFLASDEASYVNGAELAVDGGWIAGDYEATQPGGPAR